MKNRKKLASLTGSAIAIGAALTGESQATCKDKCVTRGKEAVRSEEHPERAESLPKFMQKSLYAVTTPMIHNGGFATGIYMPMSARPIDKKG